MTTIESSSLQPANLISNISLICCNDKAKYFSFNLGQKVSIVQPQEPNSQQSTGKQRQKTPKK